MHFGQGRAERQMILLGDFFKTQLAKMPQENKVPVEFRQRLQGLLQLRLFFHLFEMLLRQRIAGGCLCERIWRRSIVLVETLDGALALQPASPVVSDIGRDAKEPMFEFALMLISLDVFEQPEKNFLGHVVRVCRRARYPEKIGV